MRARQRTAAPTEVIGDADGFAELIRPHFADMIRFAQRLVGDHGADDVLSIRPILSQPQPVLLTPVR